MAQGVLPRRERLEAIKLLLKAVARAANHDEALALLSRIINEYENANSGVPYYPEGARTKDDGRIYGPWADSEKTSTIEGVRKYRTKGHYVLIGANGAIAWQNAMTLTIEFSMPGADENEIAI